MKRNLLQTFFVLIFWSNVFSQTTFEIKYNIAYKSDVPTMSYFSNGNAVFYTRVRNSTSFQDDFNLTMVDSLGSVIWSKTFGDSTENDEGYTCIPISDGNFIVSGGSPAGNNGGLFLAKFDLNGNNIWAKSIGGNNGEIGDASPVETHDKGIAACGLSWSFGAGVSDFYLIKTDSLGNLLWAKSYGGTDEDAAESLIETKDHGFIMAGSTRSFNTQNTDIYVVRTDSVGNLLWSRKYGRNGTVFSNAFSINETPDNGYLISGVTGTAAHLCFLKIDSIGNLKWRKVYNNFAWGYAMMLPNYEILAYGTLYDSTGFLLYPGIIKTDSIGNIIWSKAYHTAPHASPCSFTIANDGSLIFLCMAGNYDTLLLVKTDNLWNSNCAEGSLNINVTTPVFHDTIVTSIEDSGGVSVNVNLPVTNISVFMADACIPLSITETKDSFTEIEIFPNPFTLGISITLRKQNIQQAIFTVKNIFGQTVFNDQENNLNNNYSKPIDLNFLSNGIYLVDVNIDGERTVRKIVKE